MSNTDMDEGVADGDLQRVEPGEGPSIDKIDDEVLIREYNRYSPPSDRDDLSLLSAMARELEKRGYDPAVVSE